MENTTASTTQYTETTLPEGFSYLEDICPQIVQDIKYATIDNFTGKIVDGYTSGKAILTTNAANALCEAHKELEQQGLTFLIWDAYRPTRAVQQFLNWGDEPDDYIIKKQYHPTLSKQNLFEQGFISPHNSTHSRGSTVDLTIIDQKTNAPLDMGTDFDFFGEKSYTANQEISLQAQENRKIVSKSMNRV